MGTTQRPPRRIVPPSMPKTQHAPPPVSYSPPKYADPSSISWKKLSLVGAVSFVVVAGGLLALQALTPPQNPAILAAIEERAAELQGAQQERAKDATAAGWVGTLNLPIERATISINTIPDDGRTAREWNDNTAQAVSLAVMGIDNSSGAEELTVDTSKATLQLKDGTTKPAIEPMFVLQTVKRDREQTTKDLLPPFHCAVGRKMIGKVLFLPRGIDPQTISSITISINGKDHQIAGEFLNTAQKAATTRNSAARQSGAAS
jgi:hypothetical protein